MIPSDVLAVLAFLVGVAIVVWATERLLHGLVGLAGLLRLAPFVIAGVFSGLEAENVAVGVTAGRSGANEIALGTCFGGGSFLVCVALGLGALLFPLQVRLPRGILMLLAATPVLGGLALVGGSTTRWSGALLLVAFVAGIGYLVRACRGHQFLVDSGEVAEAAQQSRRWWWPVGLTLVGLVAITAGAELVTFGAEGIIRSFAVPAALIGMIVTPAAIEAEEVIRQAIPAKQGRPDVSAGNLVGTLLYFVLFNLGLIALVSPVAVPTRVGVLDWPFLVASTWLATFFLWRGGVSRPQGAALLLLYAGYVVASVFVA